MTRAARFCLALASVVGGMALAAPSALAVPPSRIVKGPYVSTFSDTSADIRFELDAPGPATLALGRVRSNTAVRKITDATAAATHVVHAAGLEPATTYEYAISLGGPVIASGRVTTAPASGSHASLHFAVYGDDRSDPVAHSMIVRAIGQTRADFLLNTGDIVEDGASAADWQSFFQIEAPLLRERPLLLSIGNHELYDDESGSNFARYFGYPDATGAPRPYGTVRIGDARFFFLNAMHDWSAGEERDWLERELAHADDEAGLVWRIAVVHHGPWSSGPHGGSQRLVSAHVPDLLARHKVDLLLSGHDHIYERGDSGTMKYIVSGGGGAPLYRIAGAISTTRKAEPAYHFIDVTLTPGQLQLVAQRADGSLLDKCSFDKGQPWACDPAAVAPPAPQAAPAPAVTPPSSPQPAPSRCNVAVPGAPVGGMPALAAAFVLSLARLVRRRRG